VNEDNLISIVVVGAMNPRIHHPLWYNLVGIIDHKETDYALERDDLICTPPISKFLTSQFLIICQQDRWEIQTKVFNKSKEIISVAKRVFDILDETPIQNFGFNFNFIRKNPHGNTVHISSDLIKKIDIGLPKKEGVANFTFSWKESKRKTTVIIKPIENDENLLSVSINLHYNIEEIIGKSKRFDLGELFTKHFQYDEKESYNLLNDIIANFGKNEV
jgi:hypothetical protein